MEACLRSGGEIEAEEFDDSYGNIETATISSVKACATEGQEDLENESAAIEVSGTDCWLCQSEKSRVCFGSERLG